MEKINSLIKNIALLGECRLVLVTDEPSELFRLLEELKYTPETIASTITLSIYYQIIDFLAAICEINSEYELIYSQFTNLGSKQYMSYTLNSPDAVPPSKVRASDSGYDLTLIRKIKTVGDVEFYDTGVSVTPPEGYYFDLVPRSSISKTSFMLANSVGVIDQGYTGNIIVPLRNLGGTELELPNRLVQLIPRKIEHFIPICVQSLQNSSRGSGGFGSTGK